MKCMIVGSKSVWRAAGFGGGAFDKRAGYVGGRGDLQKVMDPRKKAGGTVWGGRGSGVVVAMCGTALLYMRRSRVVGFGGP